MIHHLIIYRYATLVSVASLKCSCYVARMRVGRRRTVPSLHDDELVRDDFVRQRPRPPRPDLIHMLYTCSQSAQACEHDVSACKIGVHEVCM